MSLVHGLQGILDRYGPLTVQDGQIVAPRAWEAHWMTRLQHDIIPGGGLYVNRELAPVLAATLDEIASAGIEYAIRTMGCFAPRPKRGHAGRLSVHSWGLAVDINPDENPRQEPLTTDMPDAWVAIWLRHGWVWGANFPTPDPMHFQLVEGY